MKRTRDAARAIGTLAAALVGASLVLPAGTAAQEGAGPEPELTFGGLLRTGLRIGPGALGRSDGFRLHDVRVDASGRIGIVFDYLVRAEWDADREEARLLDAKLSLPVSDALRVDMGQFRAPLGKEALKAKGEVFFVERAQASQLVAPGRQVGVQATGETLEGRLRYAGGVFNGNGRRFENDDNGLLWAGRAEFNNVGAAEFWDELVVEVGANVAFSRDSAVDLGAGTAGELRADGLDLSAFRGDRLLLGGDLRLGYRGFFVRGEYLRAELEPEPAAADGEVTFEGGYLEGGYNLWGAVEGVVRWDRLSGPLRSVDGFDVDADEAVTDASDFLVFGVALFPGYNTKVGLQYAVGLGGTRIGPGLADGEFQLLAQVDF